MSGTKRTGSAQEILNRAFGATALPGSPEDFIFSTMGRAKALRVPVPRYVKTEDDGGIIDEVEMAFEPFRIVMLPSPVFIKGVSPASATGEKEIPLSLQLKDISFFSIAVPDELTVDDHVEVLRDWCKWTTDRLKAALEGQEGTPPVRYAVFGELSFPSFSPGNTSLDQITPAAQAKLGQLRDEFSRGLQDLAVRHRVIIIGGSFHDPVSFQNVADIYFPAKQSPLRHEKLTAAQAINEYINVMRGIRYPIYNVGPLKFCVLICSDAFDLNIFFQQVVSPRLAKDATPSVYFVPSFYLPDRQKQNHRMAQACCQLSKATGKIVVFVNQSSDPKLATVYIAGEEQTLMPRDGIHFLTVDPEHVAKVREPTEDFRARLQAIFRSEP